MTVEDYLVEKEFELMQKQVAVLRKARWHDFITFANISRTLKSFEIIENALDNIIKIRQPKKRKRRVMVDE